MESRTGRQLLLILVVCGLCFFTRLGSPKLWDRDEPRNARCAWEMWERHDWVVPTFNGELRAHKPILLYWLMMTAYATFGVNEFAARFWSAALATGTVGLTYGIGRRLFDSRTATWSAIILATTLMFNVAAHAATPDSALIFCTTLAMAFFVRALAWSSDATGNSRDAPVEPIDRAAPWWIAAGIAMGFGVLAKGPVGFVLPVTIWCLFLWGVRRVGPPAVRSLASNDVHSWTARLQTELVPRLHPAHLARCLVVWHPLLVTSVMLIVAVPWYFVVGQRTDGAWLREFFFEHNVSRAMQPMEGHTGNALLFYPVAILVGFFPWSALTIPAAIWITGRRQGPGYDPRFGFCLAWVGVFVGAFSLAGTKLPSYVTPTYPALALMVGHFVANGRVSSAAPANWWPRWSAATLIVVGLLLAAALPWAARAYLPGEEWLGAVGLILLVGGGACLRQFRRGQLEAGWQRLAGTAICFVIALFGWVAPRISSHQQIQQLLATVRQVDPAAPLATLEVHEPSWVFYAGKTLPLVHADTPQQAKDLVGQSRGFLITTRRHYERLRAMLPPDVAILDNVPYFLKRDELLLIGPPDVIAVRAAAASHR